MPPSAELHSDGADGSKKVITLDATGPSTGHISVTDSAGPSENFDLYNIQADPAALKMTCKADVLLVHPDVTIFVKKSSGKILADITISHWLGSTTTEYPLRQGEDATIQAFLGQAEFPPL